MKRKNSITTIRLTKHVRQRRKKGYIPQEILFKVAKHLILSHDLKNKKDGVYKFVKRGTSAVINKQNKTYVFVTFFGRTGYVLDTEDFGDFHCIYQSEEYIKAKLERIAKRKEFAAKRKSTQKEKNTEPLHLLSKTITDKLKKGNFIIEELPKNIREIFQSKCNKKQIFYIFKSKFDNYPFIELLANNGLPCITLTKSKYELMIKENDNAIKNT